MHVLKRISIAIVALVGGQFLSASAIAASSSYFLNLSNESGAFPDGTPYLQVDISDGTGGNIDFSVMTLPALSQYADSNYGIQAFSFNFGDSGATSGNLVLPDSWSVKNGNSSHSIFGKFDTTIKGTGSSRKDPLKFSITGVDGDTPDDYASLLSIGGESVLFAAHVAGFLVSIDGDEFSRQITSAQFGGSGVVPLPASAWLMLSALSACGAWARRRRSQISST